MSNRLALALALAPLPALAEAPRVVTDTPIVHSLAAQVMQGAGTPEVLLDRGADPHAFQLRPSQARSLAAAEVVFWVGPELTPWLARALEGSGSSAKMVELLKAEGVALLSYRDDDHAKGHDHSGEAHDHAGKHGDDHAEEEHGPAHGEDQAEGHDHDHAGTDPHAWLDPANARAWVAGIAAVLAEADPANAQVYASNAAAAQAGIDAAEAGARATLAPVAGRPIFVYHDAYRYFSHAFGVEVAGTVAAGDAAEPGAASLAALRQEIAAAGGTCVFAEANHDTAYVTNLIEGTGAGTGTLDPDGSAFEPGPDLYARTLQALADEIARCLGEAG